MQDRQGKKIPNGKKIRSVYLVYNEQYPESKNEIIELLNGDCDLDWAIVLDKKTGEEIKRFNLKLCEGVEWVRSFD